MKEYTTVRGDCKSELIVKKSRFIASVFHVENQDAIRERLSFVTKEHYKATHNTYAYRIIIPVITSKFSDDGEPSQTAGKPIFGVLESFGLYDVLIIVTRYFGGIKLGANGVVRAYSKCASEALARSVLIKRVPSCKINVKYDYKYHDKIMSTISLSKEISIGKQSFLGDVTIECITPIESSETFKKSLSEICFGNVVFFDEEELYVDKRIEK